VVRTKDGFVEKQVLKATTVHQELRVLRRMLNLAIRKKFRFANPCAGLEFPARVDGLFRPHYVTWSEQQKIESAAPEDLRNVIRIVTETGLRIDKELTPMKKDQLDLVNRMVWIPDSKTPKRVAEVQLTNIAADAFRNQLAISGPGPCSGVTRMPAAIRRCSKRLARDAAAGEGVQEVFANEAANGTRGAGET
jgi:integrase